MKRVMLIIVVCVAFLTSSVPALANASYSAWIHELVQKGQNVEVTINIFDESSDETVHGVPFPSFDVSYTLNRWGAETPIFENRVFKKEDAESVTEYECQHEDDFGDWSEDCEETDGGVSGCPSFCAVAYRFTAVDECVPPNGHEVYYSLTSNELEAMSEEFVAMEGFGQEKLIVEDTGDKCLKPSSNESGCSVSSAGRRGASVADVLVALLKIF